jgi:hypothetical protein
LSTPDSLPITLGMPTVLLLGIVLIAASVVVLVWAFPTRR